MPNVLAFLSYVFVTSFTPGPNNIMALSNATQFGFRKSAPFRVGAAVGFGLVMALGMVFSISLYNAIPTIKPYVTVAGAAYILWLAYRTVTSSSHAEGPSGQNTFLAGMLLQFLNPKAIVYGFTVAATFIVPFYRAIPVLAGFAAALGLVGLAAMTAWALFGTVFERFMTDNHRIVSYTMGALLVYCAVSLFF